MLGELKACPLNILYCIVSKLLFLVLSYFLRSDLGHK